MSDVERFMRRLNVKGEEMSEGLRDVSFTGSSNLSYSGNVYDLSRDSLGGLRIPLMR